MDYEVEHGDEKMSNTGTALEIIQLWKLLPRHSKVKVALIMALLWLAGGAIQNMMGYAFAGLDFFRLQKHIQVTYQPLEDTVNSLRARTYRIEAGESLRAQDHNRLVDLEKTVQADTASRDIIAKSILDLAEMDRTHWEKTKDLISTVNNHTVKLYGKHAK